MSIEEKVRSYLIDGLSQKAAAEAAGCTEAYVSQLWESTDFKQSVAGKRAERVQRYKTMDDKMDSLESNILDKMERAVSMGLACKPSELVNMFAKINGAKRRSVIPVGEQNQSSTIVQIFMPQSMQQRYKVTVDTQNKVVQIGEETMVPASATTVHRMAQERQAQIDVERTIEAPTPYVPRRTGELTEQDF